MKIIFLIFFVSVKIFAAACCGGGASFPSLILGDDRAQVGFSAGSAFVIGDALNDGEPIFRSTNDSERVVTTTLDAATLLSDRWQAGFNFPFVGRLRSNGMRQNKAWGLGDVATTLGFEALPEFSYSSWRPRGFLYAQFIFPTGGNVYDSNAPYEINAFGRGFYSVVIGSYLLKSWSDWDASIRFSYGHLWARTFQTPNGGLIYVTPGQALLLAAGVGYSPKLGNWRFGATISPDFESASNVMGHRLVWNTSLDVSYLWNRRWTFAMTYLDQTWLGPARNSTLSRSASISVRYKWER